MAEKDRKERTEGKVKEGEGERMGKKEGGRREGCSTQTAYQG
jgi:hypothetical protein